MWRLVIITALLVVGNAPPPSMPDMVEAGRVAAQLSDWQTIVYFLAVLLAVATVERVIAGISQRAVARALADAMDRLAAALQSNSTDIKVHLALLQQNQGLILRKLGEDQ